jgi:hypothetical protein
MSKQRQAQAGAGETERPTTSSRAKPAVATAGGSSTSTAGSNGASRDGNAGRTPPSQRTAATTRPYKRDSPKGRMLRAQMQQADGELAEATPEPEAVTPNGAHPARRRRKRSR